MLCKLAENYVKNVIFHYSNRFLPLFWIIFGQFRNFSSHLGHFWINFNNFFRYLCELFFQFLGNFYNNNFKKFCSVSNNFNIGNSTNFKFQKSKLKKWQSNWNYKNRNSFIEKSIYPTPFYPLDTWCNNLENFKPIVKKMKKKLYYSNSYHNLNIFCPFIIFSSHFL